MDQLYPLLYADTRAVSPHTDQLDPKSGPAEPDQAGTDAPAPDQAERRVEAPFGKALTDREREAAFATIMHWAMYGGC